MKSLKKNFLSLLLTFIIAIQLMPLRVWAAQDILGKMI